MPYIKEENRKKIKIITGSEGMSEGELNYIISKACLKYLEVYGENYKTYNSIIGALECAKLEFYRRKVVPYEEKKCKESGDVF